MRGISLGHWTGNAGYGSVQFLLVKIAVRNALICGINRKSAEIAEEKSLIASKSWESRQISMNKGKKYPYFRQKASESGNNGKSDP